ncbi:MAG: DUF3231 family protein [Bacillota bacterium]|uniref:DUF3231 family protein n=1 Tax=Cytobacillus firmus TaxID=1399 RepID=UPI00064E5C80|nr:DUF3231 family protein [Cytobacillus firmus]KML41166.1 transcriptional regulator [Cytobacillus firmus]MBG9447116.1 transcriptional regulator [Cytobacillus firmus]MBY6052827.1 DUF3231 family protein [Cytobacillus firmus]WHY60113.1 DUF3231 family protein [Cytobacillus firmus]
MPGGNYEDKLTAAEHATLWSQYVNDSLAVCILRHFLNHVKDKEIRKVLEFALKLSESHIKKINGFLSKENQPIPIGFTDKDVNVHAPLLFTDIFMGMYIHIMAIHGGTRYSGALSNATRADIRKYMKQVIDETMELFDRSADVLIEKGVMVKPPILNNQHEIDFVGKQSYLTGWFGKRRPVNAIEISGIYLNMQKIMMKVVLELGFGQVAQHKEVQKYMERSRQLCRKHLEILSGILTQSNLNIPRTFEAEVTDSTTPPFSDKLMMYHISTLLSASIGFYGEAMAMSQRRDIAANYARMIAEIGLLAEDGMNLLIEQGWFEMPPMAADHENLSKKKF